MLKQKKLKKKFRCSGCKVTQILVELFILVLSFNLQTFIYLCVYKYLNKK